MHVCMFDCVGQLVCENCVWKYKINIGSHMVSCIHGIYFPLRICRHAYAYCFKRKACMYTRVYTNVCTYIYMCLLHDAKTWHKVKSTRSNMLTTRSRCMT